MKLYISFYKNATTVLWKYWRGVFKLYTLCEGLKSNCGHDAHFFPVFLVDPSKLESTRGAFVAEIQGEKSCHSKLTHFETSLLSNRRVCLPAISFYERGSISAATNFPIGVYLNTCLNFPSWYLRLENFLISRLSFTFVLIPVSTLPDS